MHGSFYSKVDRRAHLFALVALGAASGVAAQPAPPEAVLCTDRPTKANAVCTVPKGMVQIEADLFGWQASRRGGARADVLVFGNPTIKYGLSERSDIQLNWSPYARVRSRDAAGDVRTDAGIGDVTVRFKQRLTAPGEALQVALLPFVKLPTAPSSIGNGKVEGGLAIPVSYSIDGGWTLTIGPQLDLLADDDGQGRHVGVTGLVNISKQIGRFTLYNEIWTSQSFDPSGTVSQWSYDVALAFLPVPAWQIDVGANIGLNKATPDLYGYLGVSTFF